MVLILVDFGVSWFLIFPGFRVLRFGFSGSLGFDVLVLCLRT